MSTVADLIARTRRHLSDPPGLRNKVASHVTGQVTFVNELKSIAAATRFSAGLQTFYVWDALQGTNTVMVDVIEGGSGLLAAGTTVLVNPRYTDFAIMEALNDTLNSLSSPTAGLYQMKATEIPYDYTLVGYNLSALDVDSIYEVLAAQPGPYKQWVRLHPSLVRLDRTANAIDFTSGQALNVWQPAYQGYQMRIIYKAPFGKFAAITDTPASVGLPDTCEDLLTTGAAIRLMVGKEIARNDTQSQGDTRRAGEVPPGAVANSVNGLRLEYRDRLVEEASRLARKYPSFRSD